MKKRGLMAALMMGMTVVGLTACGNNKNGANAANAGNKGETAQESAVEETESGSDLSGTVTLAGSTSMEKLCEALSESFMAKYPGISVTAEYTGSGAGLESLAAGSVDIGNASRHLKDEEKDLTENIVAIDGIAVITEKENSVDEVTAEELAKIYKGEITNWSELGGKDEAIVAIGREAGSGTRDAFEELLEVTDECKYAQELDSTGAALAKVASTPGAIGYVSLDVLDDSVTTLALDGVEPTEENILAGDYLLSRPFVMATNGEISEQNELVKTWFDYVKSEEGQNVISSIGLILPE